MNPISNKLSWKYQKNKHLIGSLLFKNAPEFVYASKPPEIEGEIPIFTFHVSLPDVFEEQCKYLSENKYHTLSGDEFFFALTSPRRSVKKSIVLTFDDGLKHVWTVVYPLLKKYNLKAICFIIPGCIPNNEHQVRPTLEDYWKGKATLKDIISLNDGDPVLCTWNEIKIMHESGLIDFQSHTMYHSLVFTADKIFDFLHPDYNKHIYGNIHIPLYLENGTEVISREGFLGMPIYFSKPRMSAKRRFFDDEEIRKRCVEFVKIEGAEKYFERKNWRKDLREVIFKYRKTFNTKEKYETSEERDRVVYEELWTSKKAIEEKLPGKKVTHLCYPWYEAEDFAVHASREAGFKVNYFGQIRGRPTNRSGDDPYKIVREEDIFLLRLPGAGRKSLIDIFKQIYDFRKIPKLLFE